MRCQVFKPRSFGLVASQWTLGLLLDGAYGDLCLRVGRNGRCLFDWGFQEYAAARLRNNHLRLVGRAHVVNLPLRAILVPAEMTIIALKRCRA